MEFVLVTDCHIKKSSNVRTDEDYLGTLLKKLDFCIECANKWDARLVMAGDFFDTPTVPDLVKNRTIKVLKKAKKLPWTIYGNHCTLFNNPDNNYKTSTYLFDEAGVWKSFGSGDDFVYTENGISCKVAFTRPMINSDIPQLGLFHGFLNKEDGPNTFLFEDVCDDNCAICLGHDHVPYEPIKYKNSVIFRIGSMVRAIRNDSEDRIPQLLRLRLKSDGKWAFKAYDIPCISPDLIFKEKKVKAIKNQDDNYAQIIEQMKMVSEKEITLVDAVKMVAKEDTVEYIKEVLNDVSNIKESK